MTRTKSLRYNAASDEPLLIQSGKDFFENCKGKWGSEYFGNNNPIVLELACGRGEYTVWLSQIYPDKNFIGVDVKGERMMQWIKIWRQQAESNKQQEKPWNLWLEAWCQPNIWFLRTIIHHIDQFFAPWEVDEIWIVHPDPRPKWHDERRRITSPRFLKMYDNILKPGGLLRLKTDDDGLFEYSIEQLREYKSSIVAHDHSDTVAEKKWFELIDTTWDLDQSPLLDDHHGIETHYGLLFKSEGRTIKYGVRKKCR